MMPVYSNFDAVVERQGSIAVLTVVSPAARAWVEEHCSTQPWQWTGNQLAVDRRMVEDIVEGMIEAGLEVVP